VNDGAADGGIPAGSPFGTMLNMANCVTGRAGAAAVRSESAAQRIANRPGTATSFRRAVNATPRSTFSGELASCECRARDDQS